MARNVVIDSGKLERSRELTITWIINTHPDWLLCHGLIMADDHLYRHVWCESPDSNMAYDAVTESYIPLASYRKSVPYATRYSFVQNGFMSKNGALHTAVDGLWDNFFLFANAEPVPADVLQAIIESAHKEKAVAYV